LPLEGFFGAPFQQFRYLVIDFSSKSKSERARTALLKNNAKQVIRELAPNNPVYYEKLRERLKKILPVMIV
jgi:hypothetical protein